MATFSVPKGYLPMGVALHDFSVTLSKNRHDKGLYDFSVTLIKQRLGKGLHDFSVTLTKHRAWQRAS